MVEFEDTPIESLKQRRLAPVNFDQKKPTLKITLPKELFEITGKTLATIQNDLNFGYAADENDRVILYRNVDSGEYKSAREWVRHNKDYLEKLYKYIRAAISGYLAEFAQKESDIRWELSVDLKDEDGVVVAIKAKTAEKLFEVLVECSE